ncbi:MAG: TatD family hydrolase [Leptospiraceae bacterium]
MAVYDTHCHLDIVASQGIPVDQSLQNAIEANLAGLVQISTDLRSASFNGSLKEKYSERLKMADAFSLRWTAGLHPEAANELESLNGIFDIVRKHRDEPEFLGIGETGLDYFHTTEFVKEQKESLNQHLKLARELDLPVVIHTRDTRQYEPGKTQSVTDTLQAVKEVGGIKGVLHCFTYSYEEAMPFVEMGWKVSFSGILTFKNSHTLHEAAVKLPLECLMVETDAPFLAPVPHRGKTNEPAYVIHTLEFLKKLRSEKLGEDPEKIQSQIERNIQEFLSFKG